MADDARRAVSRQGAVSRRRFVAAVGAAGVSGSLAGCFGGNDEVSEEFDSEEEVTLQWAVSEEENAVADELVDALHEAGMPENIRIDFLAGGRLADERQEQYDQWLSEGRSEPDLLRMDNGWTIPFIERDQLLDLSANLSEDELARIDDAYFDMPVETARSEDGNLFAVPLWVELPTILYRRDLVEKAGYDPNSQNWATQSLSWEAFSQVIASTQEQSDVEYGYTFQGADYEGLSCCTFNELITSWGGAYFGGPENLFGPIAERPVTVNEAPAHNAIRMVQQFIYGEHDGTLIGGFAGGITPQDVLQMTEQESIAPFSNGNAVAHRGWPMRIVEHGSEDAFGEDLGVMPIPYGVTEAQAQYEGTGGPTGALGGQHLAVNPNSEQLPAAMEVVKAAMADEFTFTIFETLGRLPPKPDVMDSERARNVPTVGRYLDTLQVVGDNAMAHPATAAWPEQSTAIANEVNTAFGMNKRSERAMTELANTIESIEVQNA